MRAHTPNKELRQLIRKLSKNGWVVTATRSSHLVWTSPSGRVHTSGSTPSRNALRKTLAELGKIDRMEAVR